MFFIKTLLILLALHPKVENWQRINTEQSITFLFPNNAQQLIKNTDGILSHVYQTKDETCVYGVVCSDMSKGKIHLSEENLELMYEKLKESSLFIETAKLKEETTIPFGTMVIKEITYTLMKDNYEMTYFKRFIFKGNYIYQTSIGGRSRHIDIIKENREIFFNSIYFN